MSIAIFGCKFLCIEKLCLCFCCDGFLKRYVYEDSESEFFSNIYSKVIFIIKQFQDLPINYRSLAMLTKSGFAFFIQHVKKKYSFKLYIYILTNLFHMFVCLFGMNSYFI